MKINIVGYPENCSQSLRCNKYILGQSLTLSIFPPEFCLGGYYLKGEGRGIVYRFYTFLIHHNPIQTYLRQYFFCKKVS